MIVVVGPKASLLNAAPEEEYNRCRAAIVEAELEELDAAHGLLMLSDERIIEFDTLTILHHNDTFEA